MAPRTPFHMALAAIVPTRAEPDRSALVLIDAQRAFVDPGQGIGAEATARGVLRELDEYYRQAAAAVPNMARLAAAFRARGGLVVHTVIGAGRLSRQLRLGRLPVPADPVAGIMPEVAPQPGDVVLVRGTYGPFATPDLALALDARRIDRVFLCGMPANLSVALAAREAADRDYRVVVVQDACASETFEWQSLTMLGLSGGMIRPAWADEVVEMLDGRRT